MKTIVSIITIWISGTILHFTYDFLGRNSFVALFAPVNESVWEHCKLIFYPLLVTWLISSRHSGVLKTAVQAAFALVHSCLAMFGIYYFYTSAFGIEHILAVDILDFMICTAVGYGLLQKCGQHRYTESAGLIACAVIILMILTLWVLTYYPAELPIFIDNSGR